jgi:hypothetical protein
VEQLIFILIAGGVALANYLVKKSKESADENAPVIKPPPMTVRRTVVRPVQDDEEERVRKFMEALGMPTGGVIPKKVTSSARPVRPVQPSQSVRPMRKAQPVQALPPPITPQLTEPDQQTTSAPVFQALSPETLSSPSVPENDPSRVVQPASNPMPPLEFTMPAVAGNEAPSIPDIRALLQTPGSLRAAILLREIIGPPRGLHSY